MNAIDLVHKLKAVAPALPENTVDRVIYGDANRVVQKVAVCFMPLSETLRRAKDLGANIVVAHEPTFYAHRDLDDCPDTLSDAVEAKKRLIEKLEITIVRCHDVWDWHLRNEGTFGSWARFLGLELLPGDKGQYLCDVAPRSAGEFAEFVAARSATLGQKVVHFYGDADRIVRRVAIWGDPLQVFNCGADLALTYDDYPTVKAWIAGEWCSDTGNPLVVVNHAVLETPGIAELADYYTRLLPGIDVVHIAQGCLYREVSGRSTERRAL